MHADAADMLADQRRLAALRRLNTLDDPADAAFDRLTSLATRVLRVPSAAVQFIGDHRQYLISGVGVPEPVVRRWEIPSEWGAGPFVRALQRPTVVDDVRNDPEWAVSEAAKAFGIGAYLGIPLFQDGQSIGTFCVFDVVPRQWTDDDVALLEELAESVMTEIRLRIEAGERQRLLERHRHIAHTLQQNLLPPYLPEIPGVELAARYHPVGAGVEVGGDFYDVFATGNGEWAAVVGDVCGKGPEAAAVTALARYTIRAAAVATRDPSRVLATLNEALLRQGVDRFCTLAYLRLVPRAVRCRVTVSLAGHPPPLLLRPRGGVVELGQIGVPAVGWFPEVSYLNQAVDLRPGETAVCYTDGVTEARSGGDVLGEKRFQELLGELVEEPVDTIADTVLDRVLAFQRGHARDDVAVLVCRRAKKGDHAAPPRRRRPGR